VKTKKKSFEKYVYIRGAGPVHYNPQIQVILKGFQLSINYFEQCWAVITIAEWQL